MNDKESYVWNKVFHDDEPEKNPELDQMSLNGHFQQSEKSIMASVNLSLMFCTKKALNEPDETGEYIKRELEKVIIPELKTKIMELSHGTRN